MELRDQKVIEFIDLVELANRDHIKEVFFPEVHQNICMRRLKKLADNEYINRFKHEGNVFIYYSNKKPSKRLIHHDLYITDVVVAIIKAGCEIVEFKKSYVIGNIISDAYIQYRDPEGTTRSLFLEIQLSNKVKDCVDKYNNIKNIILEERPDWKVIPRLVVITDLKHNNEQVKNMKVKYDTTEIKNIRELLF